MAAKQYSIIRQFVRVCACGCGQPVNIAPTPNRRYGYIKGQPYRFLSGHHKRGKVVIKAYRYTQDANGQTVKCHRLRAEQALGHPLPTTAVIHHPDCDPGNPNARLVICQDQAYHMLLHQRMRVKAAGGNPNTDAVCSHCHAAKPFAAFQRNRSTYNGISQWCRACCAYIRANKKVST